MWLQIHNQFEFVALHFLSFIPSVAILILGARRHNVWPPVLSIPFDMFGFAMSLSKSTCKKVADDQELEVDVESTCAPASTAGGGSKNVGSKGGKQGKGKTARQGKGGKSREGR
jgi:hypothetical protein